MPVFIYEKRRDSKGASLPAGEKQSGGLFLAPRAGGRDVLGPAGRIPPLRPSFHDGFEAKFACFQ